MVLADLDLSLIAKRKRMMDSVGHYSRPELLSLLVNRAAQPYVRELEPLQPTPISPEPKHEPFAAAHDRTAGAEEAARALA